ncbi:MAG: NADH-dependent [FeFe] hydrogenase, group A6 [Erysipelotrichaceae bacterium]|nr:NADH-dependent [FeFe] hydrogenase, group A6 [Erysipelotrichaceae bacterium]
MSLVNIKIEGKPYQVEEGLTILQAAKKCGYNIPSLCSFMDGRCSLASCRVCLVEVKGARGLVASCAYPVNEGMEITISSTKATEARRTSVELMLSNHQKNCLQCDKNGHCELLEVSKIVGARDGMYMGSMTPTTLDEVAPGIIRNTGKCILCGRCVETCKELQGIGILGFEKRGFKTFVSPAENRSFANSPCLQCGQCVLVCPTGALMEHSEIANVDKAMREGKKVIVQTAPAVRAAIAEEFGEKIGTPGTGKMVAALHRLGFYRVFDVNFGADLTIIEEAHELLKRINNKGVLPQITSCSPGWINYMEYFYSDLIPNISTCKSPHQMQGAITKSYYAQRSGIDPKDIYVVSVMPCTAKKYEKTRDGENAVDGLSDVDAVLTTRELARMIKRAGINWQRLPEEEFDQDLLGDYSGAGVIFGVTGGVMEAALRTAYKELTGKEHDLIQFESVRGLEGVRHADININGSIVKVAVASGMKNAKILLDQIRKGESPYAFIEIMGCPGGCINGGGQPYVKPMFLPNEADNILETYRQKRASVLYKEDEKRVVRQSHNNPDIIKLYKDFLGKPCGEKSEELLHTHYNAHRERYPEKK